MIRFIMYMYEHLAVSSTAATVQHVRESLIITVDPQGSLERSNTLFSGMCRAVFNYYHTKVMAIKKSSELDDDVQLDAAEQASLAGGK